MLMHTHTHKKKPYIFINALKFEVTPLPSGRLVWLHHLYDYDFYKLTPTHTTAGSPGHTSMCTHTIQKTILYIHIHLRN